MGTRATVEITDGHETYFIYHGHDGFPDNILPDITAAITACKGRWSGAGVGQFVSYFLGFVFDPKSRLQDYELTTGFHGDESYRYWIRWDEKKQEYNCGVE